MRKHRLLLALTLLPALVHGQGAPAAALDTAAMVLDTYLRMLNHDGIPSDSTLVLETTISVYGTTDTTYMRRWFTAPDMFRVEVEHNGYLQFAIYGNGKDRFRSFNIHTREWEDVDQEHLMTHLSGYDFRTPLYRWREKKAKITWCGHTTLKGQRLQVVKVVMPGYFDRYYMFDPTNGLLTLVIETSPDSEASYQRSSQGRIDWKTYHEYLPIGEALVTSLESFMRDGQLTIMATTPRMEARNERYFNQD
ncbi:MAG: hypothetical protein J6I49_05935 [Bacteroidales bacterium]|nr:hypothetical protein [Bacteroidales bacterium]